MSALTGLKVVEWAQGVAAPYCGKLLGDQGADVVKVEPPGGDWARTLGPFPEDRPDPNRSALFIYLNTSKRGLVLDPANAGDRAVLEQLIGEADVVIEDHAPGSLDGSGLAPKELLARFPRLVVVSVTPHGQTGPARDWPSADLLTFAETGFAHVTPAQVRDPAAEPPIRMPGGQSEYVAGLTAASAALHGLLARDTTGRGQHVDVSAQEALASFAFMLIGATAMLGKPPPRQAPVNRDTAWINSLFQCSDGYVCGVMMEDRQWAGWLEVMGSPAWGSDPRFSDGFKRNENWADLKPLIEAWTSVRPKAEVSRLAQARRVPVLPVNTVADVWASDQLQARGFFQTIDQPGHGPIALPGHPYQMSRTPWRLGPAPVLDPAPAGEAAARRTDS